MLAWRDPHHQSIRSSVARRQRIRLEPGNLGAHQGESDLRQLTPPTIARHLRDLLLPLKVDLLGQPVSHCLLEDAEVQRRRLTAKQSIDSLDPEGVKSCVLANVHPPAAAARKQPRRPRRERLSPLRLFVAARPASGAD